MKLFVSYSHYNRNVIEYYINLLELANHQPWYDQNLKATKIFSDEIKQQIENSEALVFLLSQKSYESTYCQQELAYAIDHQKSVLIIRIDKFDIPDKEHTLAKLQWAADFSDVRNIKSYIEIIKPYTKFTNALNDLIGQPIVDLWARVNHSSPDVLLEPVQNDDTKGQIRSIIEEHYEYLFNNINDTEQIEIECLVEKSKYFRISGNSMKTPLFMKLYASESFNRIQIEDVLSFQEFIVGNK